MTQPPIPDTSQSFRSRWLKNSERWRDQLSGMDALPQLTILGLITGILAGLVIVGFRLLAEIPLHFLLPAHTENFEGLTSAAHFWLPFLGAVIFGTVLQTVDKNYYSVSVSHVIDRIHNHQARLPLGNFLTQFFGGAWCLLTGQSVGREGPAVHLGAGSGSLLGQWLNLPSNSLSTLAGCGVAAAIAACFNTPMAGVIFAMEVVVMEYSVTGFIPVILAAVAGTFINQWAFGFSTVFNAPQVALSSLIELPLLVLTGLVIAAFSSCYIRLHVFSAKLSSDKPILLRFAVAGLLAGAISIFVPQIMGVGYDTIDSALAGEMTLWLLISVLAAKLLVTGISLGVGLPGGVIGPLLFMGACIGGIVGLLVNMIMPESASSTGFYVLLGMGAMMGAGLNAPLAAMMTVLELTYNPNVIFPSMLVVVVACLSTRWIFKCDGIFQTLLAIHGKRSRLTGHEQLLSRTGIRSVLDRNVHLGQTVMDLHNLRNIFDRKIQWIVLEKEKVLIPTTELLRLLNNTEHSSNTQLTLTDLEIKRLDMIELADHTNLYQALLLMDQAQVDAALIKTAHAPGLAILTREHIDQYYHSL